MKRETDWKLIFVFEFDTLLFELKLLRPAFELLFALLPTSNVFFFSNECPQSPKLVEYIPENIEESNPLLYFFIYNYLS